MKKTYFPTRIIQFVIIAALLSSCEDFLDTSPSSFVTPEKFNNSRSWADATLSGVYSTFQSEYYQFDMFVNGDVTSDIAYAGGDNAANFEIDDLAVTPTNGNVKRDWEYLYTAIGTANVFIDKIDSIQDPNLPQSLKNQLKGEARFIRAVHYFNLVRLWGGVPMVTKSNDPASATLPRATEDQVYTQIISDLEFAYQNCKQSGVDPGRIRKGAAFGMLAKVYASKPQKDWDKVNQYCDSVLNDSQYSLLPNYEFLFDGNHENSSESLFEIQFVATVSPRWGVQLFLPPSLTGDGWKKFNTPSKELVGAYDSETDDVRKPAGILWEDVSGSYSDDIWGTNMPFPYKAKIANGWNSGNNIIYLRLADIILLKAEALNEKGNLADADVELNLIRDRANLTAKHPATRQEMFFAIEKERQMELGLEGYRWFDLKRTGRALDVMKASMSRKPGVYYTYIDQNDLLWPIPQSEIDKNPNLVQNPGY